MKLNILHVSKFKDRTIRLKCLLNGEAVEFTRKFNIDRYYWDCDFQCIGIFTDEFCYGSLEEVKGAAEISLNRFYERKGIG